MEEVTESSVRTTQETFMPLVLQSYLESDATQLLELDADSYFPS